jgi:hypothetical protein
MTLNQRYKASGSTLSFKDWLEVQKTLGLIEPKNDVLQEPREQQQTQQQQTTQQQQATQPKQQKVAPSDYNFSVSYQPTNNQKTMFWVIGGLAVVGIGIWAYKKYAKK